MLTDLDYELPRAKLLKGRKKTIRKFLLIEFAEVIEANEISLKKVFSLFRCEKK